jgi:hypothetical protein
MVRAIYGKFVEFVGVSAGSAWEGIFWGTLGLCFCFPEDRGRLKIRRGLLPSAEHRRLRPT